MSSLLDTELIKFFLSGPNVPLQQPVEVAEQKRNRHMIDNLQLEGVSQTGIFFTGLVVGKLRGGFMGEKKGHPLLREAILLAISPETI